MTTKNLHRIQLAIEYILANSQAQPKLDLLAQHVSLSPHHLHRLFVQHTGVTPQQFLSAITIEKAKLLLSKNKDVLSSALDLGLSGASRLHDQFISIEAVTPGEFKSGGSNIQIYYGKSQSAFGPCFVAWTKRGIHRLEFFDKSAESLLAELVKQWPKASFHEAKTEASEIMERVFTQDHPTKLWVSATNFQMNVWKALLRIPEGSVTTYGAIASAIGDKNAQRATGSAIGKNPVAYLIPCHRVIRSTGIMNNYKWETWRKALILGTEIANTEGEGKSEDQ